MNQHIVLASRPQGMPRPEDFRLTQAPLPVPQDGQVLIRHTVLGLAPAARLRMGEAASYRAPMALGEVVYGQAVGEIVTSRAAGWHEGDTVMSLSGGWQTYSVADASSLVRVDTRIAPPSVWLGALGTSGMTAYVGLLDLGTPARGETVVVSAAAGGVGAMVGQIARLQGCRVVGIAGGSVKATHLVHTLGFDHGIDYRAPDFAAQLHTACADGVDVYFDNVGGTVRDAVWPGMNSGARVIVCGQIAEYNAERHPGPGWFDVLAKRLCIRGFIMSDHLDRRDAFPHDMAGWLRAGEIRVHEDVSHGLDSVVPAFIRMLGGENLGKTVVQL